MVIARVIFCALSSLALLGPLPHETLLTRDDGVVVAIQDEAVLELLARQAAVSLLFFTRDAYEDAILGLADSEIDAMLRKRRQDWSPNATGHGLNWIFHDARRCLTLTALARAQSPSVSAARLDDHFEQSLQLLVTITGETGYEDKMASLLVLVVEGEAKLRQEYLDAQGAARQTGDASASGRFASALKRSESHIRALGLSLKSLGRPEYNQALPYVGLSRGVFVWPRDTDLVKMLAAQREAHLTWKDGLVAGWSLDNLPELAKRGKSVRVLYFNDGQLLQDLQDLTPAQLEREFAKRFEGGRGASMQAREEHLSSLWLEQHLLRRKALAQARIQLDAALAAMLEREVTEEAQALRQALAQHPVWLAEAGTSGGGVFEALKLSEEQLLRDARFLAALCRREGDANGEALYTRISAFKPAQP